MNKREFTPEEIAKSLEVCFKTLCGCGGCIYEVEPDLSSSEVDCRTDLVNIAAGTIKTQAKRIGELEAELAKLREENRWIPVEERPPELDSEDFIHETVPVAEVLVMIEGATKPATLFFNGDTFFDLKEDGEFIPYRVTHWKHMPKGPEVGHD